MAPRGLREIVPARNLTPGELGLLNSIFASTLPYKWLRVARNENDFGGEDNSFTPDFGDTIGVSEFYESV